MGQVLPSARQLQIRIPGGKCSQKTMTSVRWPVGLPDHTVTLDATSENPVTILAFLDLPGTSVLGAAGRVMKPGGSTAGPGPAL